MDQPSYAEYDSKFKCLFLINICSGLRAEEFVYQKLDKPKPPRLTESEALGQSMIEAGNDFGPGTNYGENYKEGIQGKVT